MKGQGAHHVGKARAGCDAAGHCIRPDADGLVIARCGEQGAVRL